MERFYELVPKSKADIVTAEELKEYSYEETKPIVPKLLECIQDMNWPVAGPVANYLQTIAGHITPQIIEVLRGNDSVWKYWCLIVFGNIKPIDPLHIASAFLRTELASVRTTGLRAILKFRIFKMACENLIVLKLKVHYLSPDLQALDVVVRDSLKQNLTA